MNSFNRRTNLFVGGSVVNAHLDRRKFFGKACISAFAWLALKCQQTQAGDGPDRSSGRVAGGAAKLVTNRYELRHATNSSEVRTPWNTTSIHPPFVLYSTIETSQIDSLSERLKGFRKEVEEVLELSFSIDEIKIVVLQDKVDYDAYLVEHFPELPKRRALFVQHRGPGLVLTYLHDDWTVDARHECAHAMLHSCRTKLPSWLDEGLAEYFETIGPDRLAHQEHAKGVLAQIRYGQVPAIEELEQWHVDMALEAKQYRDAWSVVAFLLHHSPETRATFQQYLQDLQSGSAAGYLGRRLSRELRQDWRKEFLRFYQRRAT